MGGFHFLIDNARCGDEETLIRANAHIAGGSLVDPLCIHLQAGLYDLAAQIEILQLFHTDSNCEGLTSRHSFNSVAAIIGRLKWIYNCPAE